MSIGAICFVLVCGWIISPRNSRNTYTSLDHIIEREKVGMPMDLEYAITTTKNGFITTGGGKDLKRIFGDVLIRIKALLF